MNDCQDQNINQQINIFDEFSLFMQIHEEKEPLSMVSLLPLRSIPSQVSDKLTWNYIQQNEIYDDINTEQNSEYFESKVQNIEDEMINLAHLNLVDQGSSLDLIAAFNQMENNRIFVKCPQDKNPFTQSNQYLGQMLSLPDLEPQQIQDKGTPNFGGPQLTQLQENQVENDQYGNFLNSLLQTENIQRSDLILTSQSKESISEMVAYINEARLQQSIRENSNQRCDLIMKNLLREVFNCFFEKIQEMTQYSKIKRNKDKKLVIMVLDIMAREILTQTFNLSQLQNNYDANNEQNMKNANINNAEKQVQMKILKKYKKKEVVELSFVLGSIIFKKDLEKVYKNKEVGILINELHDSLQSFSLPKLRNLLKWPSFRKIMIYYTQFLHKKSFESKQVIVQNQQIYQKALNMINSTLI
eukprot:403373260